MNVASALISRLHKESMRHRFPAYVLVDRRGRLTAWGGALATYGIGDLHHGEPAATQIVLLEGLLPLGREPVLLPCVTLESGVATDVHLLPGKRGDWVLLLDARTDEASRRIGQQQRYDHALRCRAMARPPR